MKKLLCAYDHELVAGKEVQPPRHLCKVDALPYMCALSHAPSTSQTARREVLLPVHPPVTVHAVHWVAQTCNEFRGVKVVRNAARRILAEKISRALLANNQGRAGGQTVIISTAAAAAAAA
eukprot:CAMPEP_0177662002 /NCGR_PEP_ID=MMETSP0447-20121125/19029_1 /TAXON_ID=0 /ORGANISM="Stygamoeba regulata, Strain BSH-02190019" /LENGTH=120 /DNA_ID=CAMNT_0019167481 /DNA_START=377 /DNA_END=735 /DNA_ORIENTATION=+